MLITHHSHHLLLLLFNDYVSSSDVKKTAWRRVLLEQLTVSQLVKFPTFCWTCRLITSLTRVRQLLLS